MKGTLFYLLRKVDQKLEIHRRCIRISKVYEDGNFQQKNSIFLSFVEFLI